MMGNVNGVECLICSTTIISVHVHDFVSCLCPEETRVSVDGGQEYKKRAYNSNSHWKDLFTGEIWTGESFLARKPYFLP
jgi:hypothetical protein